MGLGGRITECVTVNARYAEEDIILLVRSLCAEPREAEWLEFKKDNAHGERIGEYVSALANSAALVERDHAYVLWGLEDDGHRIVGTTFRPSEAKIKKQQLEHWLVQHLAPRVDFRFHEIEMDGKQVVLLSVPRAEHQPVRFKSLSFIRIGSTTKKLTEFPEKERALWKSFETTPFESVVAVDEVSSGDVLTSLDVDRYFALLNRPRPNAEKEMLDSLSADRLVRRSQSGRWGITNLGALLCAKRLSDFGRLGRKAVRVVRYKGDSKIETTKEEEFEGGYASSFEAIVDEVVRLLPAGEVFDKSIRREIISYPVAAVRELVANAVIHQDFSIPGCGPMVEVFDRRIEITNPGKPLVPTDRFVDYPPRSRNEDMSSIMRRMGVCEERGSGIDKVLSLVEFYQLPAPVFEVVGESMRTILFAQKNLQDMSKDDKIRACYLHACLMCVTEREMNNASIRERFGIKQRNSSSASRLIADAVEAGRIVVADPKASKKFRTYVPFWAGQTR